MRAVLQGSSGQHARDGAAAAPASEVERVILVDEHDCQIGVGEKLRTHHEGVLHRAFSIFVFDARGCLLLQKRARTKYHSGGLWSNTCCGHPRPGETTAGAARRRLWEELNVECELREAFSFLYHTEVGDGLVEHELDHVFVGRFDGEPVPDAAEVEDWRWVTPDELQRELRLRPDAYSYWLRAALERAGWHSVSGLANAATSS